VHLTIAHLATLRISPELIYLKLKKFKQEEK